LFLNERVVLNKWQQLDSTGDICMYNLYGNFCGNFFFAGTFFGGIVEKTAKFEKLEPVKM